MRTARRAWGGVKPTNPRRNSSRWSFQYPVSDHALETAHSHVAASRQQAVSPRDHGSRIRSGGHMSLGIDRERHHWQAEALFDVLDQPVLLPIAVR